MSTTTTFAPRPSNIPAPVRNTDVFDFLHARKEEQNPEERITVRKSTNPNLLAVTIASPDGRTLSRKVPAESWQEEGYRGALIRSLSLLVA